MFQLISPFLYVVAFFPQTLFPQFSLMIQRVTHLLSWSERNKIASVLVLQSIRRKSSVVHKQELAEAVNSASDKTQDSTVCLVRSTGILHLLNRCSQKYLLVYLTDQKVANKHSLLELMCCLKWKAICNPTLPAVWFQVYKLRVGKL